MLKQSRGVVMLVLSGRAPWKSIGDSKFELEIGALSVPWDSTKALGQEGD